MDQYLRAPLLEVRDSALKDMLELYLVCAPRAPVQVRYLLPF
jgi:hypothetical protein